MNLKRSWYNFCMHVREEGWQSVPPLLKVRLLALVSGKVKGEEAAMRREETERYQAWLKAQEPDGQEKQRQKAAVFSHRVSFLIPTYNTNPQLLSALVDSFLAQTNDAWEACFYDGNSPKQETKAMLAQQAKRDPRIRVELGTENGGISANTNKALAMAQGDIVALVDHDDLICCDTVYQLLKAAEEGADFIYSDEDKCNDDGSLFFEPHFKPDFAPDALRNGNYICHIMAMKRELMEQVGGLRPAYDGSQDHDLALRATEKAKKIVHIKKVLYHWRMVSTSFSHQAIVRCMDSATRAVDDQLSRLGMQGTTEMFQLRPRIRYHIDRDETITLMVMAHDAGRLQGWLNTLHRRTERAMSEVIIIADTDKTFRYGGRECRAIRPEGNRYAAMNRAAKQAAGKYIITLEQGVKPLSKRWVDEMQMYARRPDVGCVGTALMGPKNRYRHCGYAVHDEGVLSYMSGAFVYGRVYMLWDRITRNVAAVSACAMMMDREKFLSAGGFGAYDDEMAAAALGVTLREQGFLNVFTPYAKMNDKGESFCPAYMTGESYNRLMAQHPGFQDIYYNPALDRRDGCMVLDRK
ncbi:MAG: glycosyltransferase [Clostridia bacterium]|nr:glycosyltransferase [Clostridia bacterium]